MPLLIIGDLHMREHLGYSEYIEDGRIKEKKEIFDFILKESKDCDGVVFLGDQFHLKNNPSEVIREFVEFVESFGNKQIYMIAGNHEKSGDGKSALDFMKEVNKPNWHIITDKVEKIGEMVFCPFFYKGELKSMNFKTATTKLMKELPEGRIFFTHHAISDIDFGRSNTNLMTQEIVLPMKTIGKKYELTFAGHIHSPIKNGNVIVSGSIFNNELGDKDKKIYKLHINERGTEIDTISLPGRKIISLSPDEVEKSDSLGGSIVKVIIEKAISRNKILELKELLSKKCDAYVIVERVKNTDREKSHLDSIMNLSVEELLKIYAKEKKLDVEKVLNGFKLING